MNIKKTIMAVAVASMMAFIGGCDKDLPTPEKMKAVSTVVGKTAGYACELAKTKKEVKDAIANVLDIVGKVTPTEDQTFVDAWTPVIDEELKKLVTAGKIGDSEATIAKFALTTATEGIDYVFVKYPKAKEVKDLVGAAVEGFIDGYKSVVSFAADGKPEIDEEAYKYLKSKMAARK